MNYYGAKDIARSFRTVRENTLTIARDISAEQYGFRATLDTRSVAQVLTHIAVFYRFHHQIHAVEHLFNLEDFDFFSFFGAIQAEEEKNRNRDQILELLETEGEKWTGWVDGLSDEFLAEQVEMPGQTPSSKSRFEMIISVKEHEMHHRGQLMLMQRMIGLVPHLTRRMQEFIAEAQKS